MRLAFICFMFLAVVGYGQTTKIEYFRATVEQGEVVLKWRTFAEDGTDIFTVYKAQDAASWQSVAMVPTIETKTGSNYETNAGALHGTWYYKLVWKEGLSYATSTIIVKDTFHGFNVLGQITSEQKIKI